MIQALRLKPTSKRQWITSYVEKARLPFETSYESWKVEARSLAFVACPIELVSSGRTTQFVLYIALRMVKSDCQSALPVCSKATPCSADRWMWWRLPVGVPTTAVSVQSSKCEDATFTHILSSVCWPTSAMPVAMVHAPSSSWTITSPLTSDVSKHCAMRSPRRG